MGNDELPFTTGYKNIDTKKPAQWRAAGMVARCRSSVKVQEKGLGAAGMKTQRGGLTLKIIIMV